MKIPVLIDLETIPPEDPNFEGLTEAVRESMEFHVIASLHDLGYDAPVVPFGPDPLHTLRTLLDLKPDLVFNLTEHFRGDRRQDANIAGLLDLVGLPYTGSGPGTLILCRDKILCKRVLGHHRIRVPHFFSVPPGRNVPKGRRNFPLIVKPALEDGSDGISMASIVNDPAELATRVAMIHERMKQPAICEEYIEGQELYVGLIGNERLTAFPAREIRFGRTGDGGPSIATSRVKWDEAYREKWAITYAHADLPPDLERRVAHTSKKIYRHLQLRDYARIDLRLSPQGDIVFLEANPNPNISAGEDLAEAAERTGIEHTQLIEKLVAIALKRVSATA
ncbi:MAG TPA: ATP-grasp domain-containing protein [Kiritimatiellia bacterium]|nr:ATP-grasp domain-containing protein [Kiritimatiellia bacterium]